MTSADDVDDTHMSTLSKSQQRDIHHILLSSGGDGGPENEFNDWRPKLAWGSNTVDQLAPCGGCDLNSV